MHIRYPDATQAGPAFAAGPSFRAAFAPARERPEGPLTSLTRASRRTRRTALLLAEAALHVKQRLVPLPEGTVATLRRQGYASFVAENICAINGFELRVSGELPRGPSILVCNHIGWQDPILINSVIPALAVGKIEVSRWPVLGELARGLDHMFVERGSAHSGARVLLRARTLLERGASILTFPEGTTTRGGRILPFHRGIFGLARLTGAAIIPIALSYTDPGAAWVDDESFFPSFSRTVARRRTVSYLDFGPPLQARPEESAEALAARTRAMMLELLEARAVTAEPCP